MNRRKLFGTIGLGAVAAGLAACAGKTSLDVNTSNLDKNAQAASQLMTVLLTASGLVKYIPANTLKTLQAIQSNVLTITSEITQASDGKITVDISKNWASSLVSEIQQFVAILTPIVNTYAPAYANYLNLATALLPFIQAVISTVVTNTASVRFGSTLTDAQIRALIYKGPGV